MRRERIAAIILAGGQSRRMGGGDKCLADLAGRPLLSHVLDRLRPQTGAVALSANGDPARFSAFGMSVLPDPVDGFAGPLAGLLAGLQWATTLPGVTHLLSVAADTPFLPADLATRLAAATGENCQTVAVAASAGRRHPVFALWPVSCRDALAEWLAGTENRKVGAWLDRHKVEQVSFEPARYGDETIDPFFNINTPADLAEANRIAAMVNR